MIRERHFTAGGADVYIASDCRLNSFCIGAYYLAGSMFEDARENGISHLYEHVVFRNLKKLYGGKLYTLLSENGLFLDGSTGKEYTSFTVDGVTDGLDLAIDVIGKLFLPITIDEDELYAEKMRVLAEMNEDDEKNTLDWLHWRCCWGDTFPAGGNIGRRSNLKRTGVKQLNEFRERVISKGNLFFYVTGNVPAEYEEKLLEAVRGIPVSPVSLGREDIAPVGPGFRFGSKEIRIKDSDWCDVRLSFGFPAEAAPFPVRDLIYCALYDNDDCAFYQELSENDPTVYDFSGTLEQYRNFCRMELSYEVDERYLLRSLAAAVRAIDSIKRADFDVELNKKKLAAAHTLSLDRPARLCDDLAYYNHILGEDGVDWSRPALGRYDGVTAEDVKAAARRMFTGENLVLTLRADRRRADKRAMWEILDSLGK